MYIYIYKIKLNEREIPLPRSRYRYLWWNPPSDYGNFLYTQCQLNASAFVMYTVGPPSSPQSIMLQVSL